MKKTKAAAAVRRKKRIYTLCLAASVGALYVVLTWLSASVGLSSGVMQVRISDALCILPFFVPQTAIGLFAGCMLANLLTNAMIFDVIFGSIATLLGAVFAALMGVIYRKSIANKGKNAFASVVRALSPLGTTAANAFIVPAVLIFAYGIESGYWFLVLTVLIGEVLSAWVLGLLLLFLIEKNGKMFKLHIEN